jgi:hypothetical protein
MLEYAAINVPALAIFERRAVRGKEERGTAGPVSELIEHHKREGPLHMIGTTTLVVTSNLMYGVIASVSFAFCQMLQSRSGQEIDWQNDSLLARLCSHSLASVVTYPLFLASYQVRHHAWSGLSGLVPSGERMYSQLRSNVVAHMADTIVYHSVRPIVIETMYLLFGEWLVAKADSETLSDQIAYHVGIRAIHALGSILAGCVHLPTSTIATKMRANPNKYDGVLDCIKQTWREQGLNGFYCNPLWFLLAHTQLITP